MALQAAYKQFLANPNTAALAANASLHYITSTTSKHGATEILKHFATLRNQVRRKKEEFLNVVEGGNAIACEVDSALEFLTSGGPYLPALDDNFLTDRTVYLPIVHIVSFDADGKISQIRVSWDQGALLKQLDVIGKTGRNWPIRDSTEQTRLITTSVKAVPVSTTSQVATEEVPLRSRGNSNALRDPHASLELFAPREDEGLASVVSPYAGSKRPPQKDFSELFGDEAGEETTPRAVVSPYTGTRPRERSFTEILGEEPDEVQSPSAGRQRSESPSKAVAPKIGSHKNFQPIRLFEGDENNEPQPDTPDKTKTPASAYRPHPKKYNHFDFADGSDPQDAPQKGFTTDQAPKTKHGSHWSFDDFETPQKPKVRQPRAQEVRHWGTENDEVQETPARKPVAPKPRRDAETHFEFVDDGLPSGESRPAAKARGSQHNTGLHLYENNLYNEDGSAPTPDAPGARALGNITNLKDRSKIFDPHFAMTDDPQGPPPTAHHSKASDDRMKVVKMMESNWAAYDESPQGPFKENLSAATNGRGIATVGDGMGGKKTGGRGWAIGDESDEEVGSAVPGKKPSQQKAATGGGFWDF